MAGDWSSVGTETSYCRRFDSQFAFASREDEIGNVNSTNNGRWSDRASGPTVALTTPMFLLATNTWSIRTPCHLVNLVCPRPKPTAEYASTILLQCRRKIALSMG